MNFLLHREQFNTPVRKANKVCEMTDVYDGDACVSRGACCKYNTLQH